MLLVASALLSLLLYTPSCAFSISLPTSMEVDIIFPLPGGLYAITTPFPVLIAVQNSAAAYDYGYDFLWSINPCNTCATIPESSIGAFGDIQITENSAPPPDNPHIEINSTSMLQAGEWIFNWSLATGPTCAVGPTFIYQTFGSPVGNGSFTFTVSNGAPAPTFTAACPSAAGIISYSTVGTYSVPGGLHTCPVTASATPAPMPCQVTINGAQASSISEVLRLSVIVSATSTTTMSSSSRVVLTSSSQARSSSGLPAQTSTVPTQTSSSAGASKTNAASVVLPGFGLLSGLSLGGIAVMVF